MNSPCPFCQGPAAVSITISRATAPCNSPCGAVFSLPMHETQQPTCSRTWGCTCVPSDHVRHGHAPTRLAQLTNGSSINIEPLLCSLRTSRPSSYTPSKLLEQTSRNSGIQLHRSARPATVGLCLEIMKRCSPIHDPKHASSPPTFTSACVPPLSTPLLQRVSRFRPYSHGSLSSSYHQVPM